MNVVTRNSQAPRPWFISLTAIWEDDPEALGRLERMLNDLPIHDLYPGHHVEVRRPARHFTAFAILRITRVPCPDISFRQFSRELLTRLRASQGLVAALHQAFGPGLALEAYEIRAYDNSTALQFRSQGGLARFRDLVRSALSSPVDEIIRGYPADHIESMIHDCHKSRGGHAFGSLARSPSRSDSSVERWRIPVNPVIQFRFARIHLLTSDEMLTNPREPGEETLEIRAGGA